MDLIIDGLLQQSQNCYENCKKVHKVLWDLYSKLRTIKDTGQKLDDDVANALEKKGEGEKPTLSFFIS